MVTFTPEFDVFLQIAGGRIVADSLPHGHDGMVVLTAAGHTWTVHRFAGRHSLAFDGGKPVMRETDLGSIQKTLAMEIGPDVRTNLGLPPVGFLPDVFTLAPNMAYLKSGFGMELNWRENGKLCRVVAEDGNTIESLYTYRSQYLRHSLNAILASFVNPGPGIFTDEAPEATRPVDLPERTRNWLSTLAPDQGVRRQSVIYDSNDGGIRISVVDGGFRVDQRGERERRFETFAFWAASMEVLQVYLTHRYAWAPRAKNGLRQTVVVPSQGVLADGFRIEPIEPNSMDNRPVKLLREGRLQAIVASSFIDGDWFDVKNLSQLLTIGIDLLELSYLDPNGAPALEPVRRDR
jgi:hypothetical protein